MAINQVQKVIGYIQAQLGNEPVGPKKTFVVDNRIAQIAREQFSHNFAINSCRSSRSALCGAVSCGGTLLSAPLFFFSPLLAIGTLTVSIILNRLWVSTRNPEGYILQEALKTRDEGVIIEKLSQGANIYQKVWPSGGAAPGLFSFIKGAPRSVMEYFAEIGCTKVVAYIAMLEPNPEKRSEMATKALHFCRDTKTAQLLLDLGGSAIGMRPFIVTDLELIRFLVANGAVLDEGIDDYVKWNADCEERQRRFGGNWGPGNNEGVNINLHPEFRTPLEWLLFDDIGPHGLIKSPFHENPSAYLEAMGLHPSVYLKKSSAEELFHSLNQAGVRIRLENTAKLFMELNL